jgi:hypothetical protein
MAFNHYAKIKRILSDYDNWYIVQINKPTTAKKFNGEKVQYDHYYRVYDSHDKPIAFCKFQQLQRFANTMNIPIETLPVFSQ